MPFPGAITLDMLRRRGITTLHVACTKCPRGGRYNLALLIKRMEPDKELPVLREELSADCPKWQNTADIYDRCGCYFPDLALSGKR
jgi:hypothetical protein